MTRRDLFPTPVWRIEGAPQQLVDELYEGAYKFKEVYTDTPERSNEGGYQTPNLKWKDFHPQGIEYVNKVVGDIFEGVSVQSWWYNINMKNHWNVPHIHPQCDLALVFYLTDSDGLLNLMSPFPQRRTALSKSSKENLDFIGGDHVSIRANKGDIIMFPADIHHFVKPNKKDTDRISISMNLQLS